MMGMKVVMTSGANEYLMRLEINLAEMIAKVMEYVPKEASMGLQILAVMETFGVIRA